jgi:hypothetical protein
MTYQYQVAGQTVTLEEQANMVAVRFTEPAPHSARAALADRAGADFSERFEVPNEKFTILKTPQLEKAEPIARRIEQSGQGAGIATAVARTTPVFKIGDVSVLATDRVLLGMQNHDEQPAPLLQKYRTTSIQSRGEGEYTVHLAEDVDPLQVAQELSGRPGVAYVEPDFVNLGYDSALKHSADITPPLADDSLLEEPALRDGTPATVPQNDLAIELGEHGWAIKLRNGQSRITINGQGKLASEAAGPVPLPLPIPIPVPLPPIPVPPIPVPFPPIMLDPLLSKQYALGLIKARDAWRHVRANPAVRIAILDEGVDTRHEDLSLAVVAGYDAVDGDAFQEPYAWNGHGTACAGLAAATPNNLRGIRGVAGGCSLMAARIAYSSGPGAGWTYTNGQIAGAIDWAWRHGADVLSNSWGGGAPSTAVIQAFDRARRYGRAGKGCVIVVSAGNYRPGHSTAVTFPATLPDVLAVTATNERDEFKTPTSSDGETWWGSCFGPQADIAAPGVHNYTTDITGPGGYSSGSYYPNFNGTSSAAPLVAGAAALILSKNPSLTEARVRQILCQAADQVGPYPYPGGRNDQYGHGRLNVYKAVLMA